MTTSGDRPGPHTPSVHPSVQQSATDAPWSDHHRDYLPASLPDGTIPIPLFGARVIVCIGEQGEPMYACQVDGAHVDVFRLAGYLDALKQKLLAEHMAHAIREL